MVLTTGFHPKPAMSFGPALALGVPSLQEYVDIRLAEPLEHASLQALLPALSAASPEGLRFCAAARLPDDEPAVSRRVRIARYGVLLGHRTNGATPTPEELWAKIAATLAATSITISRGAETEARLVELRPSLLSAGPALPETLAALKRAGIATGSAAFEVEVLLGPGPCPKPSELGTVLFGFRAEASRAVRLALLPELSDRARPVLPD
jgi:radical SAM-linked protein